MITNNQRPVVEFPPNVPVPITLKYSAAKMLNTANGDRAMYSTTDGRALFLDPEVARQIEDAGVKAKEPFLLTKRQNGAREKATWEVSRPIGEQPNGTFVVPVDPEPAPAKPMVRAEHISSLSLTEEAKGAVDAFAEVLAHGLSKHQGRVKPDEIQRIFTTVYIQRKGAA